MATSEMRSFFKVILTSTLQEGKLKIPKKFSKEQAGELPESVRLCLPNGRCWSVRIERETDNDIWLHDGLLKFIKDNSIGMEYILVFKYDGNSEFSVLIFDLTAAEIQYSCIDDSINHDNTDPILIAETVEGKNGFGKSSIGRAESDDSDLEYLSFSRVCVSRGTKIVGRSYFTRRKEAIEGGIEVKRSLRNLREDNAADEDNVKTDHHEKNSTMYKDKTRNDGVGVSPGDAGKEKILEPGNNSSPNFFKVTMTSSYIEKRILGIPSKFSQLHMSNSTRFIKLVDAENNEWVVRYIHRGYSNVLTSGWGRFVQDKKLVVGDVCIFELAQGDDELKLRVTISRSEIYSCIDDSINHDNTDRILIAETVEGKNGYGKSAIDSAESDYSAVECLGSLSEGVLQETDKVRRWYFTRRRKQAIEGGIEKKRSLQKLREANGANEDNVKIYLHGKNSTVYKDTGRNEGTNVSPREPINNSSINFFKVTLQPCYIEKGHLYVPCDFALLHMPDSTRLIKVVDAENNEWVVRYFHRGNRNYLSSGWGCFVKDKKLMVGDVCIFEHVKDADEVKLRVTISRSGPILIAETVEGKNGSGKSATDGAESDDSAVECLGSLTEGVLQETNKVRRWYFTRRRKQAIEGGIEKKRSLQKLREANGANEDNVKIYLHGKNSTVYKDTGINEGSNVSPSEPMNKSSPNFFKVTLIPCYIDKGQLYVPCDFARLHMSDSRMLVKLVDAENNEWLVRYIHRGNWNSLGSGWGGFVQDKKLMVGDVCTFKCVKDADEVKLRVTISRSGKHHEGSDDAKMI